MNSTVVFLHGGPGGKTGIANTRFFDPSKYRVVVFDQRGCGRSQPRNEIRNNTSQHLVNDIEMLREHLGVKHWHMVFGGSWGSCLSLLYTQTHPDRVKSVVIRGVHTARRLEYAHSRRTPYGAAKFYPEMYDQFIGFIPAAERDDVIAAYYKRLTSNDPALIAAAAREWNRWDLTLNALRRPEGLYSELDDADSCLTHALMESHYFSHGAFIEDGQILSNMNRMKEIPGRFPINLSTLMAMTHLWYRRNSSGPL